MQYSYPNILYIYKMGSKSGQTVSKCWDDKDQVSKNKNLPNTSNYLGLCSCLPKWFRQSYILFQIVEICYNKQIHEK